MMLCIIVSAFFSCNFCLLGMVIRFVFMASISPIGFFGPMLCLLSMICSIFE